MKKHLSSLIAGILFFSAASFAQDRAKAKNAQEPVKATTTVHEEKGERVSATPKAGTATTQAAPAKRKLVKKQIVQKGDMKAAPVNDAKAK
ncbi:MAG: hypothetical protein ACJ77K_07980 [Bacteroidia bacterium]